MTNGLWGTGPWGSVARNPDGTWPPRPDFEHVVWGTGPETVLTPDQHQHLMRGICRTCGVSIRMQIFRGTGYCSGRCEKQGKEVADDHRQRATAGADRPRTRRRTQHPDRGRAF